MCFDYDFFVIENLCVKYVKITHFLDFLRENKLS